MWTRVPLKVHAKSVLRETYWPALAVTFFAAIIINWPMFVCNIAFPSSTLFNPITNLKRYWLWQIPITVYAVFCGNVVYVGMCRFFVRNRDDDTQCHHLFSGFHSHYWKIVGTQFITHLIIDLWSLLLIIPGIVVAYQYCMVPYLLSEDPTMSGKRARELSSKMTSGQKLNIFALDLSFLGWYLLGALCLIVGIIFVNPYYGATKAELYITLRDNQGITFPDHFERNDDDVSMEP